MDNCTVDGRVDEWMDGQLHSGWVGGCVDGWVDGWTTAQWMGGWMDGLMTGSWIVGR